MMICYDPVAVCRVLQHYIAYYYDVMCMYVATTMSLKDGPLLLGGVDPARGMDTYFYLIFFNFGEVKSFYIFFYLK